MALGGLDVGARTISWLALPYGPVGVSGRAKWCFADGSVTWDGRLRLLREHDQAQRLGVVSASLVAAGIWARALVSRGPAGDRALALAAAGVLNGFSAGVRVLESMRRHGVMVVLRAVLDEVSLVRSPGFSAARFGGAL